MKKKTQNNIKIFTVLLPFTINVFQREKAFFTKTFKGAAATSIGVGRANFTFFIILITSNNMGVRLFYSFKLENFFVCDLLIKFDLSPILIFFCFFL